MFHFLLQSILRSLARRILARYHPKVVGITGSVGKTSTKEAVAAVLAERYRVRANRKNYNNELGVPLSIIGAETGGRNLLRWLRAFGRAISLLTARDSHYPEVLVLEMGADQPGDIRYLTSFVTCDVGVVTAVGPVHLEQFRTLEAVAAEKKVVVSHLPRTAVAVLNGDDPAVSAMAADTRAFTLTFGTGEAATVRGIEIEPTWRGTDQGQTAAGLSLKIVYRGAVVPVLLPGVLGAHQAYAALAAAAVGIALDVNLHQVVQGLTKFTPPPGRMHIIPGIKQTFLIDDSYNSPPPAALAALEALAALPVPGTRWAILGDMAELGPASVSGHEEVGRAAARHADYLVTVGELAKEMARAARAAGMSEDKIFRFNNAVEAGRFVQGELKANSIVLIKGSQVARMERAVEELMAEPERAAELLVRQGPEWKG